jgi:glutathione S-transferase
MSGPPPLRLHGHAVSNYFNTVHAVLIEKQADFTVVPCGASRDAAFLAYSPLGKIPFLETADGCLSETLPILEYLEDTLPGPRLHPADPLLRARGRQLINLTQLYLDAPLRRLYPGVFAAGSNSSDTVHAVAQQLEITVEGLRRLLICQPFLLGTTPTLADFFCLFAFDLSDRVTHSVYGWSLKDRLPGLAAWSTAMQSRASVAPVVAGFFAALADYLVDKQARYALSDGGGLLQQTTSPLPHAARSPA